MELHAKVVYRTPVRVALSPAKLSFASGKPKVGTRRQIVPLNHTFFKATIDEGDKNISYSSAFENWTKLPAHPHPNCLQPRPFNPVKKGEGGKLPNKREKERRRYNANVCRAQKSHLISASLMIATVRHLKMKRRVLEG